MRLFSRRAGTKLFEFEATSRSIDYGLRWECYDIVEDMESVIKKNALWFIVSCCRPG